MLFFKMLVRGVRLKLSCFSVMIAACFALVAANGQGNENAPAAYEPSLSHADAAIIFAKYSGLFDRYVPDDASVSDCVSFLNGAGIYFGLLEIVNGADFTVHDCARVMGQMSLLFSGEAEFMIGKVKLPSGIDSWEEFCMLNDVQYVQGYKKLAAALGALREIAN